MKRKNDVGVLIRCATQQDYIIIPSALVSIRVLSMYEYQRINVSTRDDFKPFEIIPRAKLRQINYQGMKNRTAFRIIKLKSNYNFGPKLTGEDSGKRLYKAVCQCGNRCFYFVHYCYPEAHTRVQIILTSFSLTVCLNKLGSCQGWGG